MSIAKRMVILYVALAWVFTACTVVDRAYRAPNWPEMRVFEHHVSHVEMRDRCAKYTPFWGSPEACAEWNLETKECHIWMSLDFPPSRQIVEHERAHCAGYVRHA